MDAWTRWQDFRTAPQLPTLILARCRRVAVHVFTHLRAWQAHAARQLHAPARVPATSDAASGSLLGRGLRSMR